MNVETRTLTVYLKPMWTATSTVRFFQAMELPKRLSVTDFFRRPWFRRVWVIQEVSRGTPVTALCGKRYMNWKTCALGAKVLSASVIENGMWPAGQLDLDTRIGLIHACTTLSQPMWLETLSFVELLYYAMHYDAGNERDKIYALLGRSNNATLHSFPADYRISLPEILNRISPLLFLERRTFDPLNCIQHEERLPQHAPSWIIDLDTIRTSPIIAPPSVAQSSGWERYGNRNPEFSVNATEIRITGRLVDSVSDISDPASTKLPDYELWQWSPEVLEQALDKLVLHLPLSEQPAAFRSFVEACSLGRSSAIRGQMLDTDHIRDSHGRLLLATIFYYTSTNHPPSAPSYLGVTDISSPESPDLDENGDPVPARSVYEMYNINNEYNLEAMSEYAGVKLQVVLKHYGVEKSFDQAA